MSFLIGDILEATHRCQMRNQLGMFTWHWEVLAQDGAPSETEVVGAYSLYYAAAIKDLLSVQASYLGVTLQRLAPAPTGAKWEASGGTGSGTTGGDALPMQVSGLISKYSAIAGRRERGRAYMPFPSELRNTASAFPDTIYLTQLGTLRDLLFPNQVLVTNAVPLRTITLRPVIWHRDTGTSSIVARTLLRAAWATQRRRGDFGRPNVAPV